MICFIALIVFGILGIFSATHRKIAKEAFDCVFRRVTLRKCTTGLDIKLKSQITGKFLENNPKLGTFLYRRFEIISWLFTILLVVSLIWSGVSAYNYYEYGNCNGPSVEDQEGLCLFDPTGENAEISTCSDTEILAQNPTAEPTTNEINLSLFPTYSGKNAQDQVVYVGCYSCINTKKVNPVMNQLAANNKDTINFVFIHFPLHNDFEYLFSIENCLYQKDQSSYWSFHDKLMQMPVEEVKQKEKVLAALGNSEEILACAESAEIKALTERQFQEIKKMNIEGTPTIFVNEQVFIGSKPLRVYERQLSTDTDWFGIGLMSLGAIIILIIIYFAVFKRKE